MSLGMAATTSCVAQDDPVAIAEASEWASQEARGQAAEAGVPVGDVEVRQFPADAAPRLMAMGFLNDGDDVLGWLAEHAPAVCITATQSYLPMGTEVVEA